MTIEVLDPAVRTDAPITTDQPTDHPQPVITLHRRTVDRVLIAIGAVAAVVFAVAGGLLSWGNNFAGDYVHRELTAQHVFFPDAAALTAEGRTDLVGHAGKQVSNGDLAEVYAGYIDGHLAKVAKGQTYADLGVTETAAKAAVTAAKTANAPAAEVTALQATADNVAAQRNTLFKGETLRGLLLTTYAWSTIGTIAGIAAAVAFAAAAAVAALVVLGMVHLRRQAHHS